MTMGRSFHWMDQAATLRALDGMVERDGGIVTVGEDERVWNVPGVWQEAVRGVVQRWLGGARRAGSGTYTQSAEPFEAVFERSAFARVEPYSLAFQRTVTAGEIVGYLYSTSYCAPSLLGERRAPFEADLRRTLHTLAPDGRFTEDVALGAWLAWRG